VTTASDPRNVLLTATAASQVFARRVADALGVPLSPVDRQDFPDGEHYLRFDLDSRLGLVGKRVVLVGATESDRSIDEVYRLGCAAVKSGAQTLVLVLPYFGYSTMERAVKPGEVVSAKTVARMLSVIPRAPQGNWVLLMDLHASGIVHYFEGDVVALELYAESKLVPAIESLGLSDLCLASTDMGRAKWVEVFANRLQAPVALIHKKRLSGSQTKVAAVVGDVEGRNVVLFDDMIRTGGSLIQAAQTYLAAGAKSVHAATTHLVLPAGTVEKLEASPLGTIIGTDTHPNHQLVEGRPRFQVVSVADLFADVVTKLVSCDGRGVS
jgi:ribose-phosphate pyrophosphokinase